MKGHVADRSEERKANLKSKRLLSKANHLLDMAKLRRMIRDPNRLPLTPKMRAEATSLLLELNEEDDKVGSLPTSADLNRGVRKLARTMRKRTRRSPTRSKRSRS